jgi:ligand-binding sensor domain-containing protein
MLFEDSKGRIWVGSENNGLSCFDPVNRVMLHYPELESLIGSHTVLTFCEDENGTIFIGTSSGLYTLDSAGLLSHVPFNRQGRDYPVRSLLVRSDGRILAGTDGNGIKLFNTATLQLEDYELMSTPFDFSKTNILSIIEDEHKNVWVGVLQKGLLLIPSSSNKFKSRFFSWLLRL